jgi:hypothetical protein
MYGLKTKSLIFSQDQNCQIAKYIPYQLALVAWFGDHKIGFKEDCQTN